MKKTLVAVSLAVAALGASASTVAPADVDWVSKSGQTFAGSLASVYDNVFDANAVSWTASTPAAGAIVYDLGALTSVNGLTLQLSGDDKYKVQVSTTGKAGTWTDVFMFNDKQSTSDALTTVSTSFAAVTAQYVRVFATLANNPATGAFAVGEMQVSAVPEPATTALFLAGLGALGFMSRRRKTQD